MLQVILLTGNSACNEINDTAHDIHVPAF